MTVAAPVEYELPPLSAPQLALVQATERCVDAEGAIRSGKSTAAALKCWLRCLTEAGINILASRWKQQDVDGQLRGLWRQVGEWFPPECHPSWNAQEECYEFPEIDGKVSRLYMRSLKSSEETGRYSKFRGLTLAEIWLEQAEEIPHDIYTELKGRLSQPGYAKQILLTPNPVDDDHWIATEFPADTNKSNHAYITSDVYSNRAILGDEVIAGFEEDFPPGHPKRQTLILGQRGVNVIGQPVYHGYFDLSLVKPVAFNPDYELLEGWDFGHAYPAVTFAQYIAHEDRLNVLGAVQGRDMFLEDFAPAVAEIRDEWFPFAMGLHWCDPSGETGNQGIKQTALLTLRDHGIPALPAEKANDPVVRDKAIQTISALMWRRRFAVHPRCVEIGRAKGQLVKRETNLVVAALSSGYVWDERKTLATHPNIRTPKKPTRYDHTMNGLEYIVIGARVPAKPKSHELERAAARQRPALQRLHEQLHQRRLSELRKAQRDPGESFRWNQNRTHGRGGY